MKLLFCNVIVGCCHQWEKDKCNKGILGRGKELGDIRIILLGKGGGFEAFHV